jgi:hypothetical protein
MELRSMCPLAATSFVWQPRPGTHVLSIVCKATYTLTRGVSPLAEAQEDIAEHDNHWDDDERASLYAASDLSPPKRRADVVLVGAAFAPGGAPVRSLVATLEAGDVKKSIEVCCDRAFTYDGRMLEGAPFARMALRWERAAGGPETANPVGVRMGGAPNADGVIPIPNLQPRRARIAWPGDTFEPVGFGPIAPSWPWRARALRGLSSPSRWLGEPLPPGFDQGFFNVAPPDQQIAALAPEARITLTNLHPRYPRLVTNLARVRPRAVVERASGRAPVDLVCDTLWIDTDRSIATLTFRGVLMLSRADEPGLVTIATEAQAPEPRAPTPTPVEASATPRPPMGTLVLPSLAAPRAPRGRAGTLVDVSLAPRDAGPHTPRAPLPAFIDAEPEVARRRRVATLVDTSAAAVAEALPFVPARSGEARTEPPPPPRPPPLPSAKLPSAKIPSAKLPSSEETTSAIDLDALREQRAQRDALPFASSAPPAPSKPPAKSTWGDEPTGTIELDKLRARTMPFAPSTSPATKPIVADDPSQSAPEASPAFWQRLVVGGEDGAPVTPRVPETPLAGASALLALTAKAPAPIAPPAPREAAQAPVLPFARGVAAPLPPQAAQVASAPPDRVAEARSIEVYATVKAALWRGEGSTRAEVEQKLRELGVDEEAYFADEERLLEALAEEASQGRATLARAVRAAIKRAVRQPRVSQASGNVPAV